MEYAFDPREPEDLMSDADLMIDWDYSDYYEYIELFNEQREEDE